MNENENKDDEIEIDLVEIWGILKKRVLFITAVSFIFVAAAVSYCFIKAPTYQSVSLISTDSIHTHSIINAGSIYTNPIIRAGSNPMIFFQTRDVLEPIMKEYVSTENEKAPNFDTFKQNIKFNQAKGSNDITITVTANSPEVAQKINQAIIKGGKEFYIKLSSDKLDASIKSAEVILARMGETASNTEKDLHNTSSHATDSTSHDIKIAKFTTVLLAKMKAAESLANLQQEKVLLSESFSVIQSPSFEENPVVPQKLKICSIALVIGLFAGCLFAIGKEKLM